MAIGFCIHLPWPDKLLSPNSRAHYLAVSQKKKVAKHDAWARCLQVMGPWRPGFGGCKSAHLSITFHPPDKRRRDLDNCLASIKAALDGIAKAIECDDSKFSLLIGMGDPVPGGKVSITITPREALEAIGVKWKGTIE